MNRLLPTFARISRGILFGKYGLLPLRFLRIQYRITPTHVEVLVDGVPERRVPLDQVLDAVAVEHSFAHPFAFWRFFPPWRYERWCNDLKHPTVLIHRRSGPHLIITPTDARAFIDELNHARANVAHVEA